MFEPRVLIRTLPLRHGNYGGALQGYALQRITAQFAVEVATDVSVVPSVKGSIVNRVLPLKQTVVKRPVFRREIAEEVHRPINQFLDAHMNLTRLFKTGRRPDPQVLDAFNTIIVGSDQIWRAAYGDVASYLLDFLPDESPVRRIAYAASFGSDSREMLEPLRALAPYARRFRSVSVREDWAVDVCSELWGVEASHVLDPVLLLTAGEYSTLAGSAVGTAKGGLFAFLLDPNPRKLEQARSSASFLDLPLATMTPAPTPGYGEYHESSPGAPQPSMEEWIASFAAADAVVTDSFHGVVMAITFGKPFVALGNASRGTGRFGSLLGLLGLEERLLGSDDLPSLWREPVDWRAVTAALEAARSASLEFLKSSLSESS